MFNSHNQLVERIITRVKELVDMKMPELRYIHPDYVEHDTNIREATKGDSKGELIEAILLEEFSLEFDLEFEGQSQEDHERDRYQRLTEARAYIHDSGFTFEELRGE
jgi:hypothetical protein